jgi:hypothetical protein
MEEKQRVTNIGLEKGGRKIGESFLHAIALIIVLGGAAGSLGLMFNAGRNQRSILLIILFTGWVLSPFIGLLVANVISKRWSMSTRATLYFLILFITLGSLVCYSGAFSPPGTKPAFKFLIVPLISWLLIMVVIPIVQKISRKKNDIY